MEGDYNMYNNKYLFELFSDKNFDIKNILDYYIEYISVFYCIDITNDSELNNKIDNLESYINRKVGINNV